MAILNASDIVDSWHAVLENCADASPALFKGVIERIEAGQPPNIVYREEFVASGFWKSLTGKGRQFLMISNTMSKLVDYRFYLTSEPYGKHLSVGWYLTGPGGVVRRLAAATGFGVFLRGANLDLFESQELLNFAALVHNATVKSAEAILITAGTPEARVSRLTKGFLGLS